VMCAGIDAVRRGWGVRGGRSSPGNVAPASYALSMASAALPFQRASSTRHASATATPAAHAAMRPARAPSSESARRRAGGGTRSAARLHDAAHPSRGAWRARHAS